MASKFEQVHNECQRRVCVCCYRKGGRTISSKEVECIDSYLIERYTVEDPDFPNTLCTDCHIEQNKKMNDSGYHRVPKLDDYDPGRLKYLRSSLDCKCRICTVAKMTGLAYQRMVKKKKGRPAAAEKMTLKCYKVCSNCFQQIYQGSNHSVSKCRSSRRNKVSYVQELLSSPTTLQRVASRVIENHADTPLSTLGPKWKLIRTSAEASTSFTSEQLFGFQSDLGLSNRQTRLLAQDLRVAAGSGKAVEHGFKESLTKNSHTVDEYFKELKINYLRVDKDTKVSEHFEQSTILCTDLCKSVDLVLQKRSLENIPAC